MPECWVVVEDTANEQGGELIAEVVGSVAQSTGMASVCAVVLRAPQDELPAVAQLVALGVQRLYLLEHPLLAHYSTGAYVQGLAWLMQHRQSAPILIAASASVNGRDWSARLAAQYHLPLAPNCLGFTLRANELFTLRALYEGRAYAELRTTLRDRTALLTLVPGTRGLAGTNTQQGQLEVVHLTPTIAPEERIRQIALLAPSTEEVELEEAERIVAGGRGIGQQGFATLARFAHHLGAALGATRVATDQGWIEHERQIGATGKSVRPALYIACGISGAAQHVSGISDAHTIIAINPDRTAPIFALADLGLLGDANQILALAEQMLRQEVAHNPSSAYNGETESI